MIPAVSQTLARILACQTSLGTVQQISFERPRPYPLQPVGINLYAYDICQMQPESVSPTGEKTWNAATTRASSSGRLGRVKISFLVIARDWTRLGEQQLLAEAIAYFAEHSEIPEDRLVPALQGQGGVTVAIAHPQDVAALWQALDVPLQPALYLTVTVPLIGLSPLESTACWQI